MTIQKLIIEAAFGNWTKRNFETKIAKNVYVLVQCTGELYSRIPDCCNGTQGGYVAYGNCLMKYNSQSFFGGAYHSFHPKFWHVTMVLILTIYLVVL